MTAERQPTRGLYLVFAGMGLSASLVPASLPLMAADLDVDAVEVLGAVPALFGGLLAGVVTAPLLTRSRPVTSAVRIGVITQGMGLSWFALSPSPASVVAASALVGFGFGTTEVSASATARRLAAAGTTALLTRLMIAVALVAAAAPVAVLAAGRAEAGAARAVVLAAVAYHVTCVWAMAGVAVTDRAAIPRATRAALRRLPIGAAVALFFYVGIESLLAGWSAVTFEATLGLDPATSALGTSAFWVLVSAGRLASSWAQGRVSPDVIGLACAGGIAVGLGGAAMLSSRTSVAVVIVLTVAVLACGPCYAILLGRALTNVSDAATPSATAVLVGVGAAGGALIPLAAAMTASIGASR